MGWAQEETNTSQTEIPASDGGKTTWIKKQFEDLHTEFSLNVGLRNDDLNWSIAGNGINILSELAWSGIKSNQVAIANRTLLNSNVYFRGAFSYAAIQSGTVRDSDYGRSDRSGEWSRSISESPGDNLWDLSAGAGYAFFFFQDRLSIAPLIGLSYHKQNLRIQNGTQVVSEDNPFGGPNPPDIGPLSSELDSTYFSRWWGPWIGCDLYFKPKLNPPVYQTFELRFSLELHWTDYYGEGNWNLRSDLKHPKSFEHEANGFGISLMGQLLINCTEQWNIVFTASHLDWSTGSGTDRKFLSSGAASVTPFNGADWGSTAFSAGAVYRF